jgi:hypothetical protein
LQQLVLALVVRLALGVRLALELKQLVLALVVLQLVRQGELQLVRQWRRLLHHQ